MGIGPINAGELESRWSIGPWCLYYDPSRHQFPRSRPWEMTMPWRPWTCAGLGIQTAPRQVGAASANSRAARGWNLVQHRRVQTPPASNPRLQGSRRYDMSRLVLDVVEALAHWRRQKCLLVGHDWGGMVACHLAAAHPEVVGTRLG